MSELPNFDPAKPLPDERWEKYAKGRARGLTRDRAYTGAGYEASTRNAREVNGSRLEKRPEVAARILFLKTQLAMQAGGGDAGPVDSATKVQILESLLLDASLSATDRLKAIAMHSEYKQDMNLDGAVVDPCAIVAYVASFAGMQPEQVARELGGVEFIAKKLCTVTKIEPRSFLDAFGKLLAAGWRIGGGPGSPEASRIAPALPREPPPAPGVGFAAPELPPAE